MKANLPTLELVKFTTAGEMFLHHVLPAATDLLDGHQFQLRETVSKLGLDLLIMHPVVEAGDQTLGLLGVQTFKVGLGQLLGTVVLDAAIHPGNREFSQEADLGYHYLIVRVLGGNVVDLGFEGQQYITDTALDEGGGGTATAGVEYSHVAEEGTQVVVDS